MESRQTIKLTFQEPVRFIWSPPFETCLTLLIWDSCNSSRLVQIFSRHFKTRLKFLCTFSKFDSSSEELFGTTRPRQTYFYYWRFSAEFWWNALRSKSLKIAYRDITYSCLTSLPSFSLFFSYVIFLILSEAFTLFYVSCTYPTLWKWERWQIGKNNENNCLFTSSRSRELSLEGKFKINT